MMNDTQYIDIAKLRLAYDLTIFDIMHKWLQDRYSLKPSESEDLWLKVHSIIEDEVNKIHRNNFWTDTMENSHGYLYATTESGDTRFLGKIDNKIVEKINEIDEDRGDNDE